MSKPAGLGHYRLLKILGEHAGRWSTLEVSGEIWDEELGSFLDFIPRPLPSLTRLEVEIAGYSGYGIVDSPTLEFVEHLKGEACPKLHDLRIVGAAEYFEPEALVGQLMFPYGQITHLYLRHTPTAILEVLKHCRNLKSAEFCFRGRDRDVSLLAQTHNVRPISLEYLADYLKSPPDKRESVGGERRETTPGVFARLLDFMTCPNLDSLILDDVFEVDGKRRVWPAFHEFFRRSRLSADSLTSLQNQRFRLMVASRL
ncbi:hypothetical protein MPER_06461 [Moniliophthora perniciosa FA553]|nr:hypothetical protein MPER_06461 [Moniliophthora perniciosa FA553]